MRIVTWNINSVRLRLANVERLTETVKPDVICLQETKVQDPDFPHEALDALGYKYRAVRGMKSYNGVAILSRLPFTTNGGDDWCGKQDCRHVSAHLPGDIELHNFYIPAGGDIPDPKLNDKFAHKLQFMTELAAWSKKRKRSGKHGRSVIVGDFNVAPLETDVWSHKQLLTVVSHTPIEVEHLERLRAAEDWLDAVRHFIPPEEKLYSWWSYRGRDWRASDRGRRLDHIWVTRPLTSALKRAEIVKDARDWTPPSDHVPVVVDLEP
jgi:exodeoxyribonuclease-3